MIRYVRARVSRPRASRHELQSRMRDIAYALQGWDAPAWAWSYWLDCRQWGHYPYAGGRAAQPLRVLQTFERMSLWYEFTMISMQLEWLNNGKKSRL